MGTFVVGMLVLLIAGLAVRNIIRDRKSNKGCGCGSCSGCSGCKGVNSQ